MELVVSETVTEKLQGIFTQKCLNIDPNLKQQKWSDYLNNLDGIRYIEKFSNIANQTEYLIEEINNNLPFNKIILKDLVYHGNFILIDVELAEKILVLGMLP